MTIKDTNGGEAQQTESVDGSAIEGSGATEGQATRDEEASAGGKRRDGGTPAARRTVDAGATTASGLEPNVAGAACYALAWLTGLFFFFTEKNDDFVRFHAAQSIVAFGGFTVVYIVLNQILWGMIWMAGGFGLLGLYGMFTSLLSLAGLALWLGMMYMAYQGRRYELPIAGNIANNLISDSDTTVERRPQGE